MTVLIIILCVIAALLAICALRALSVKPDSAAGAGIVYDAPEREAEYGRKLGAMIRCETVSSRFDSDKTKFRAFHKEMEKLFPSVFRACEKNDLNGSLLLRWPGRTSENPIMLMSHQDVVETPGKWEHEPFGGEIADGKVWGRGAVDTKCSLFSFFQAAEELISQGFVPERDVYLASSCTEEFSGEGGVLISGYLRDHGIRLSMLIDEGGMIMDAPVDGVQGKYAMVGTFEKGYGDLKFIARGSGGHSSAPGKNTPLVRLGRFMAYTEKHDPFKMKYNPTVCEMLRRLTPNTSGTAKFLLSNMWLFAPLVKLIVKRRSPTLTAMMKTTIAFTTAKGSDGLNVIPREAFVTGNMRFIHHCPTEESIAIISKIAKKFDIDTEVIVKFDPCPTADHTGKAFRLVESVLGEVYPGVGVSPYPMTGGTDCKFYTSVCGDIIRFAPVCVDRQQAASIHGMNENIDAGVLPKAVDFYKQIITRS